MKYKISFTGSPIGTFKRYDCVINTDLDTEDREEIIIKALYNGRNSAGIKYENISWDSIVIKKEK